MKYLKSIMFLFLSGTISLIAMDGHLGKDPNFIFQDKVMEIVKSGNVQDLDVLLDANPGKSVDFEHYSSGNVPHSLANCQMLLVLLQSQEKIREYQKQLFSVLEDKDDQPLLDFLGHHQGYDIDFLQDLNKTPLEFVVNRGDIQKAEILRKAGAKLDQGYHSHPLLLISLMNRDKDMLKYLSKFNNYSDPDVDGIDINFRDSEFFWPFNYPETVLSREDRRDLYGLFDLRIYKNCPIQDELSRAASIGRIELLNRALSKNAKVNEYDTKGDTALNQACSKARISSIAFLIEKGADVNLRDKLKGRSAMHWIIRMHKKAKQKGARYMSTSELLSCSFLLMCAGANPKIKDKVGMSAYQWVEKLSIGTEEKSLITRILDIPKISHDQRIHLLADIYQFQRNELQKYIEQEHIPVPLSNGARYFWHRPECIRMKNAWVRKDMNYALTGFKDIYHAILCKSTHTELK